MTPRAGRLLVDGGVYHVLNRGNNAQTIFRHDTDYRRYLALLTAYAATYGLRVRHFVLMPDHLHLILEPTTTDALSRAMRGLNLAYTLYYQKRYGHQGHLWRGRFISLHLDREADVLEHGRYIEAHPVRSGLVQDPANYAWSSYRVYADNAASPLVDPHEPYLRLGAGVAERRERYRRFIREGLQTRPEDLQTPLRRGRRGRPRKLQSTLPGHGSVSLMGLLSLVSQLWSGSH